MSSGNDKQMGPAQLKKKIQQLRGQNKKLRAQIIEDQNILITEEAKAEQMAQKAREQNAAKEQVQQQINSRIVDQAKILDIIEKDFLNAQLNYMQQLRDIKKETIKYSRLSEIASQNLNELEKTISREFSQLKQMDLHEKLELKMVETELKSLESEEKNLLKIYFSQSLMKPGEIHEEVLKQNLLNDSAGNLPTEGELNSTQISSLLHQQKPLKDGNQDCIDRQLHQLKVLKERLEKTIYQCEPRDNSTPT